MPPTERRGRGAGRCLANGDGARPTSSPSRVEEAPRRDDARRERDRKAAEKGSEEARNGASALPDLPACAAATALLAPAGTQFAGEAR